MTGMNFSKSSFEYPVGFGFATTRFPSSPGISRTPFLTGNSCRAN